MRLTSICGALAGTLLAMAATAQTAPPAGRLLASNCFQCHGTNGAGPGFDSLAGKSAQDIYNDLREMKAKNPGNDIMKAHARGYTDAQLWQISQYFAQQVSASGGRD